MQISYDSDRKIVGLSLMPWPILGPENWFNNYSIACLYGWDVTSSKAKIYPLFTSAPPEDKVPRHNLQNLIQNPETLKILAGELKDNDILITRPLRIPEVLEGRKLLMLDPSFAKNYENKANCREYFKELPFPDHKTYELEDLLNNRVSFETVMNGQDKAVLQGDSSSGSKGTFLISSEETLNEAVNILSETKSTRAVVSDFVESAKELSIQCGVTRYGIFAGPLQRQLIAQPDLCDPSFKSREKFCGGIIDMTDNDSETYLQVTAIAKTVSERLQREGYKGIFGIDFLENREGKLYIIEVNARQTGLTPLLTGLQIPFSLLNVLELGNYDYQITDSSLALESSGALLILHSKINERKKLASIPKSGTYTTHEGQLKWVSDNIDLSSTNSGEFVIQGHYLPGMTVIPTGRLVSLLFKDQVMDKNTEVLYNGIKETISIVERNIVLN